MKKVGRGRPTKRAEDKIVRTNVGIPYRLYAEWCEYRDTVSLSKVLITALRTALNEERARREQIELLCGLNDKN